MNAIARPAQRPVLTISPSHLEIALRLVAALGILTFLYLLVQYFPALPAMIPVHFDAAGQADGWGSKNTLLFLFALVVVLVVGLTFLRRYPHKFNYLYPITPQNAEKQYRLACELLAMVQVEAVWLFTYLAWRLIVSAQQGGVSPLLVPVVVLLSVGTLVFYLVKSSHAR